MIKIKSNIESVVRNRMTGLGGIISNSKGTTRSFGVLFLIIMAFVFTFASGDAQAAQFTITTCGDCHSFPPADGSVRNSPEGAVVGSHSMHNSAGMLCTDCHIDNGTWPAGSAHRTGFINMAASIKGGSYGKGTSFAQTNTPTLDTCSSTMCHGTVSSTWGANTTNDTCTKCHGTPTASPAPDDKKAPPSDLAGDTLNTDPQVGAHAAHLNTPGITLHAISNSISCGECHIVPGLANDVGHYDTATPAELKFGTLANTGGLVSNYAPATRVCDSTWCHGAGLVDGDQLPTWNSPILVGTSADCNKCHGNPSDPAQIADHVGKGPADCNGCHEHLDTDGYTFNNISKHLDGNIDGGSCIGCHASETGSPGVYRRDVTGAAGDIEPGLASHHIQNTTALSDLSCQKCHDQTNHKTYTGGVNVYVYNADTSTGILYDGTAASLNPHCLSCHDSRAQSTTPPRPSPTRVT